MTGIDRYTNSNGFSLTRQTAKALSRIEERTAIDVTAVRAQAAVDATKLDAIGAVTQSGMQAIAMVSQLEQQLGQVVPLAVSRLQALGDVSALAMAQTVADSAAKLRQL